MAINFPDAPVNGQQFTSAGIVYTWDGFKWTAAGNALTIGDAPADGQAYGRQVVSGTMSWVAVGSGGGIADAPSNSTFYGRKNGGWVNPAHTDITDWTATLAPYALSANVPVASSTLPLMNGTAAIGVGTTFARADHVHPTDTSLLPLNGSRAMTGTLNGTAVAIGTGTYTGGEFLATGLAQPLVQVDKTATAGAISKVVGSRANSYRWELDLGDGATESGSNAGSNFNLIAYSDAGAALSTPLTIARATGAATHNGDVVINAATTNSLTINGPVGNWPGIILKAPAGQGNWITSFVGGNERWEIDLGNGVAETGGNVGSNFQIVRYADGGTAIDPPFVINRATGIVYANDGLSARQAIGDNRLINGDMRIDQRAGTGRIATSANFVCDRWYYGASQSVATWSLTNSTAMAANGFPNVIMLTANSSYTPLATDAFAFYQTIEADMISDFAWGTAGAQPVTLSFWAMASKTGTYSGCFTNYAGTRSYPFTFTIAAATTWAKYTVTIPGDTAGSWVMSGNGGSLYVVWDLGCGANNRGPAGAWANGNWNGATGAQSVVTTSGAIFQMTGVKLEIGNVATPFNRASMAKSLADCQRYYEATFPPNAAGALGAFIYVNGLVPGTQPAGNMVYFATTKRATPSFAMYSGNSGAAGVIYDGNNSTDVPVTTNPKTFGVMWYATAAASGSVNFQGNWTASAEL